MRIYRHHELIVTMLHAEIKSNHEFLHYICVCSYKILITSTFLLMISILSNQYKHPNVSNDEGMIPGEYT